jgi:flagellar hook-associated protein 3 FlgL
MRVTQNTNYEVVRDSVRRSKERMEKLQSQHATLKKLNAPSDDPIAAAKVLEIRTDKVNNDQFQMNSKLAQTFLENTDHALSELSELMVRAKEIAMSQASGASSNEETRLGVAEEVSHMYQQAVATANRRIGDRYLFGGFKTTKAPIDAHGRYQGDSGQMMVEISKDVFLSINLPGLEAFNTNPNASADSRKQFGDQPQAPRSTADLEFGSVEHTGPDNVNVFDELQNLRIGLLTGDTHAIQETLERFDQAHTRLVSMRAKIGARLQGLETANTALERHNITNAQLNSALEDADMAQVVSDLAKEETVFRSALASSQKLLQPTLLDFLK